ncbi:hypothetical protein [Pseudanabaena phage PA-SR01]|nr:hypothetical protein [Pseudanabaena phage PA-SR01]
MLYDPALGLEKIDFTLENKEQIFAEYQQDLREYVATLSNKDLQNKKLVKRYLMSCLEKKWYPILGFDSKVINHDIEDIVAPKPTFERSVNIRDILASYDPTDNWLIPNFLRTSGLYIFGAAPKTGKSLMGYHLAYSFIISGRFLGMPVRKGKVLYFQLEEDRRTIAERAHMTGFGSKNNSEVSLQVNFDPDCLVFERLFDATIDIPYLQQQIIKHQPTLVIIDSLRASTSNSEHSENTSEFGKIIAKIQAVFVQTDTCGILIHHFSKQGAKDGKKGNLVAALSGSTSIASNSSGIIGIFKKKEDEYSSDNNLPITLTTLPRQGKPITIEYRQITQEDGLWGLEVLSESQTLDDNLTGKLLRFFSTNPDKEFTLNDLSNLGSNFELKQSLLCLVDNQSIVQKHNGTTNVYIMPSESLWMVEPEKAAKQYSPAVLDAHTMMLCKDKRALYDLTHNWTAERRKAALKLLFSDEERQRLKELTTSFLYQVGDVVSHNGEDFTVIARSEKPSLRDVIYTVVDEAGQEYSLEEMLIDGLAGTVVSVESSVANEESIEDEF